MIEKVFRTSKSRLLTGLRLEGVTKLLQASKLLSSYFELKPKLDSNSIRPIFFRA